MMIAVGVGGCLSCVCLLLTKVVIDEFCEVLSTNVVLRNVVVNGVCQVPDWQLGSEIVAGSGALSAG